MNADLKIYSCSSLSGSVFSVSVPSLEVLRQEGAPGIRLASEHEIRRWLRPAPFWLHENLCLPAGVLANVVASCWEVAQCRVDERVGYVPTSNLAACWQMVRLRVDEYRSKMLADRTATYWRASQLWCPRLFCLRQLVIFTY